MDNRELEVKLYQVLDKLELLDKKFKEIEKRLETAAVNLNDIGVELSDLKNYSEVK